MSAGENLAHVHVERGPLRIEAMLAAPERARSGATGLALLVNGRPVRDRVLARAVSHSYGSVLESGRYPVGVVWLDLPPELVDVNVHPQKAEVRFTDARGVFDAITRELHAVLARAFGLPDIGHNPFANRFAAPTLKALGDAAAEAAARAVIVTNAPSAAITAAPGTTASPPTTGTAPPTTLPRPLPPNPVPDTNLFFPDANAIQFGETNAQPKGDLFGSARGIYASLRYLGQARGTFLVCEGEDGLYVLDQHAAAERVTFDRLRRAHASRSMPMQRMLVPEIVELPPSDVAILEEHTEEIAALAVEIRAVGDSAVAVHGVPAILKRAEPARLVRDLSTELTRTGERAFGGAIDLVLATMACHGSIRAGDAVSGEEALALLAALDEVDFAGHCPHGRPVVMRLGWTELERRVGR